MANKKILIITDNNRASSKFFEAPFLFSPEQVTVTGVASLNYIGFQNFNGIIIDCPALINDLTKISLGIRDSAETEALWRIFCGETGIEVFILVEQKTSPGKTMRELGISYITGPEIADLIKSLSKSFSEATKSTKPAEILTADDVRSLHQTGRRSIPTGSGLTPWAEEVAQALGMTRETCSLKHLIDFSHAGAEELKIRQEEIFSLSTKIADALFVLNPIMLSLFIKMYPSLRTRTVSSTVHWASHGAFTGETSAAMLADLRCHGAIVPAKAPYFEKKNIHQLIEQAQKYSLELFSTFTLASGTGCDIIASDGATDKQFTPLYRAQVLDQQRLPETGAIIAGPDYFLQ